MFVDPQPRLCGSDKSFLRQQRARCLSAPTHVSIAAVYFLDSAPRAVTWTLSGVRRTPHAYAGSFYFISQWEWPPGLFAVFVEHLMRAFILNDDIPESMCLRVFCAAFFDLYVRAFML